MRLVNWFKETFFRRRSKELASSALDEGRKQSTAWCESCRQWLPDVVSEHPQTMSPDSRLKYVQHLVSCGGDINSRQGSMTQLHWAANRGQAEVIEFMLENGAEVDARAKENETPLFMAVCNGWVGLCKKEAVQLLLAHGADPNAVDDRGETPLLEAVRRCGQRITEDARSEAREVVSLLLEHGAIPNLKTRNRWNPQTWAESHQGLEDVLALLMAQSKDHEGQNRRIGEESDALAALDKCWSEDLSYAEIKQAYEKALRLAGARSLKTASSHWRFAILASTNGDDSEAIEAFVRSLEHEDSQCHEWMPDAGRNPRAWENWRSAKARIG